MGTEMNGFSSGHCPSEGVSYVLAQTELSLALGFAASWPFIWRGWIPQAAVPPEPDDYISPAWPWPSCFLSQIVKVAAS